MQPFRTTVASQTPKKRHTSVTHKARDSISGYSYNGDYYHEAIAELTRKFDKPQHIVAAYLDQLEKWPKPRLDEPNTFVSFSSFLRRMVQTFRLHNFEADIKSSAALRMARDKPNPTMIIRWNQHTKSHAVLKPNLTHFADWIDSYAEACEDISQQRNQRIRVNSSSRRGPPDVSCQLCSQNHNLGRCPEHLEKSVYDQQGCVRSFNICPNCLRAPEKGLCQSKRRCLVDRCNGFHQSTLQRTDARHQQQNAQPSGNWNQSSQNNTFRDQKNQNHLNYGRNFNNENQRQQTDTNYNQQNGNMNRQGGSNSITSNRGNWNKNDFHPQPMKTQNINNNNRQQSNNQRTVAQLQAQLLSNKTTLAATNMKLLGSGRRYSCRQYQ